MVATTRPSTFERLENDLTNEAKLNEVREKQREILISCFHLLLFIQGVEMKKYHEAGQGEKYIMK